jgi:hypothetical protein
MDSSAQRLVALMGARRPVRLHDGRTATIVRVETRFPGQITSVYVYTPGGAPEERVAAEDLEEADGDAPAPRRTHA